MVVAGLVGQIVLSPVVLSDLGLHLWDAVSMMRVTAGSTIPAGIPSLARAIWNVPAAFPAVHTRHAAILLVLWLLVTSSSEPWLLVASRGNPWLLAQRMRLHCLLELLLLLLKLRLDIGHSRHLDGLWSRLYEWLSDRSWDWLRNGLRQHNLGVHLSKWNMDLSGLPEARCVDAAASECRVLFESTESIATAKAVHTSVVVLLSFGLDFSLSKHRSE